ncbi:hypothetical protein GIB67_009303, partial [Kingdonia uniflora]
MRIKVRFNLEGSKIILSLSEQVEDKYLCRLSNFKFQFSIAAHLAVCEVSGYKVCRVDLSFLFLICQSLKSISEFVKDEKSLITVSYLVNSCGLSLQSTNSASKKIYIKSTKNANFIVGLNQDFVECLSRFGKKEIEAFKLIDSV